MRQGGWRQSWSDLLASLRGGSRRTADDAQRDERGSPSGESDAPPASEQTAALSPRTAERPLEADRFRGKDEEPASPDKGGPAAALDSSEVAPRGSAHGQAQGKRSVGRFVPMALVGIVVAAPWLLWPYHFGADFLAPKPPAPDVVATFDGGTITLAEIESHIKLLMPSRARELSRSPDALLAVVEDLVSDKLVLRWAAARKPEGDEAFRHAVKHINEELSLESFAGQLHEETLAVSETEMRQYYEANQTRFAGQTFTEARDDIRRSLVGGREPELIRAYIERLRANASISRRFELLDVPPPSDEDLDRHYRANLNTFVLPRRAVVDEIEIPVSVFGDAARQRASDVLLTIRGGTSFKDAAGRFAGTRLTVNRESREGARHQDWDKNVFTLVPGELGSAFRAGDSFYVVRLNELKPARTQSLSEVRSVVAAAVAPQKEREWFEANGEKTLLTLKGQRFTLKQFYKEYEELPASVRQQYTGPAGLRKLADLLIDRMLLVADTYDKLFDVKTKPLADETRLRLLRQMMEQEEVDDKIEVAETEIQKFYDENAKRLAYPPKARIRYIRIGLGASEDERRRARQRAEDAYNKVAPGFFRDGADFTSVAQEYSEDAESAARGGEFAGWIGEGADPMSELTAHPFHEAVLRLSPGEISKPFPSGDSLYIIQILERTEPERLSLAQATPLIKEILSERKHRALAVDLQKRLLEQADVVTYPQVLEAYFEKLSRPAAQDGSKR